MELGMVLICWWIAPGRDFRGNSRSDRHPMSNDRDWSCRISRMVNEMSPGGEVRAKRVLRE